MESWAVTTPLLSREEETSAVPAPASRIHVQFWNPGRRGPSTVPTWPFQGGGWRPLPASPPAGWPSSVPGGVGGSALGGTEAPRSEKSKTHREGSSLLPAPPPVHREPGPPGRGPGSGPWCVIFTASAAAFASLKIAALSESLPPESASEGRASFARSVAVERSQGWARGPKEPQTCGAEVTLGVQSCSGARAASPPSQGPCCVVGSSRLGRLSQATG